MCENVRTLSDMYGGNYVRRNVASRYYGNDEQWKRCQQYVEQSVNYIKLFYMGRQEFDYLKFKDVDLSMVA